jgi:hypothetical protein
MNGRDEELLSAYYDGELPDEEKTRAELLLTEDVSAREALDEVAEVSGWLRELPRTAAPDGLREEVLARIRSSAAALPVKSAPVRSSWRRWAGWSALSAAGLLVAALVFRQQFERPMAPVSHRSVAMRESDLRDETPSVVASRFDTATADRSRSFAVETEESQSVDFLQVAMSNSLQFQAQLAEQLKNGQAPVAGEEYTNLTQVGDRVVVIKYRIVDVEKLPGEVQLVLTNHGIAELPESKSGLSTFEYKDGAQRLDAFYVEAPESNFTSAMTDITNLNGVMAVSENSFVATEASVANAGEPATALNESSESLVAPRVETAAAPTPAEQFPQLAPFGAVAPPSASARVADTGEESRPAAASEAGTTAALGLEAEGRPAEVEAAPPTDGYQVAVSAQQALIEELQEQEQLFFDADHDVIENQPVSSVPQQKPQLARSIQNLNWGLQKAQMQGPPAAPNRVRAVILLVPDQPE